MVAYRTLLWQALLPTRATALIAVLSGSALIALAAQLRVDLPFSPVPVTGQTFAVLLVGAALGMRLGATAVLAYLAEGLAGLPVFAGGTSAWSVSSAGVPVVLGPTAGYLVGFVGGAAVVGALAERGFDRRVATTLLALGLGDLVIYIVGLPWLARFVGADRVVTLGLVPFLVGDAFKIALAAVTLPLAWHVARPEGRLALALGKGVSRQR